jgi:hypothetical protein
METLARTSIRPEAVLDQSKVAAPKRTINQLTQRAKRPAKTPEYIHRWRTGTGLVQQGHHIAKVVGLVIYCMQ